MRSFIMSVSEKEAPFTNFVTYDKIIHD